MTVPIYRDNPLIMEVSMLCPGISQNTEHHSLTLYKGQVWEEKPYLELCNQNVLSIFYTYSANWDSQRWPVEKNGELHVPSLSINGKENKWEEMSQIPWDSEILQSFFKLTDITHITFHSSDENDEDYQLVVGSLMCQGISSNVWGHYEQCLPPNKHYPWYIWTKESFKMKI